MGIVEDSAPAWNAGHPPYGAMFVYTPVVWL
jgi:hypothetical protein